MPVNSSRFNLNLCLISLNLLLVSPAFGALPALSESQQQWLGDRVFANECNNQISCLTSWNRGENFPSLGIGHFIWYQAGQTEAFTQSFPLLLAFYRQQAIALPDWLAATASTGSPWPDRDAFYAAFDGPELTSLRAFLATTRMVQVEFMWQRLEQSLPRLLELTDPSRRAAIEALFYAIANTRPPQGVYALLDYVNFKGEGIASSEQYQGQGWGLRQVLEAMPESTEAAPDLLSQFSRTAAKILQRRVANAPQERDEQRWLAGWLKRVASYNQ